MTDAATLTDDASSTQAPVGPPPIVVVQSEGDSTTYSYAGKVAGAVRVFVCVVISFAGVQVVFRLFDGPNPSSLWLGLAIMAGTAAIVSGSMLFRGMRDWKDARARYAARTHSADPHDPAWIVQGILLEVGGLCRWHWWTGRALHKWRDRFQQRLREHGLPPALVIVQSGIEDQLRAIPIESTFVEPERLFRAMPRRSRAFWFEVFMLVFFIWTIVRSVSDGNWVMTVFFLVCALSFGFDLLRSFGVHVSEANEPVMGLGVLSDAKGRRWTVRDSVVYLYPQEAGIQSTIVVSMIGPEGHHAMYFYGHEDPGLVMFWQRWMHPHPRPELV